MGFVGDIKGVFERDPAAKNIIEVLTCYPGLHALWMHRVAHFLYKSKIPVLPRLISQFNRFFTGIEIHPGATIGNRFFIDHGSGVVIGETTEVGDNVLMYSEVVLGGTTLAKKKRHPTIGNNVVIGTGAKVLGDILIGDGAKIGACSVVVKDVPAGATAVGIPAKIVKREEPTERPDLRHGDIPDPVGKCVECIMDKIESIELELSKIRSGEQVEQPVEVAAPAAHGTGCQICSCIQNTNDICACTALGGTDESLCSYHRAKVELKEFQKRKLSGDGEQKGEEVKS